MVGNRGSQWTWSGALFLCAGVVCLLAGAMTRPRILIAVGVVWLVLGAATIAMERRKPDSGR